ncbi:MULTISPECIES: hypothetical protein [Priestia]|uniref:hypothetical protein n=1 Tax=Priestia TaxID=2800373 RepID=UPI00112C9A2A|nr:MULTISPECIES: hypothetical protein [Priestia]
MIKTYAVWYEKKEQTSNDPEIDVHFNLWQLPIKQKGVSKLMEKNDVFLDIGLMIRDVTNVKSMKLFFPFHISQEQLIDLGHIFLSHTNLITGVFNEDYTVEIGQEPKQLLVKDREKPFVIYLLDIQNGDCQIESKFGGSLVTLNTPTLFDSYKSVYYRFRICATEELKNMIRTQKSATSFLEPVSLHTNIIDFRVNEKRLYERSMSEQIKREGQFKFRKLHFLFMTDSRDELISSGENPSYRQLEKDIWHNYVGKQYNLLNIFAYHWKSEKKDSHNTLLKVKIQKSNVQKAFTYLIWLGIISVAFNLISNYAQNLLEFIKK